MRLRMRSATLAAMPTRTLSHSVSALLARQDGVIARFQALAEGVRPHDIARLVRRHEWVVHQPGIYIDHTGVPTWRQRAWAAVLGHWPAALFGVSAMRAADGTSAEDTVHVAVDRSRGRPKQVPGVRIHFVTGLHNRVQWNLGPPRMRYEDAVLDVAASARDDLAAVAVLTSACAGRRTTADKLADALDGRSRIARRGWMSAVLADAAAGTHSVLEHGYRELERVHGLPQASRQLRDRPPREWSTETRRTAGAPCWSWTVTRATRRGRSARPTWPGTWSTRPAEAPR